MEAATRKLKINNKRGSVQETEIDIEIGRVAVG